MTKKNLSLAVALLNLNMASSGIILRLSNGAHHSSISHLSDINAQLLFLDILKAVITYEHILNLELKCTW